MPNSFEEYRVKWSENLTELQKYCLLVGVSAVLAPIVSMGAAELFKIVRDKIKKRK